jgi:hypothetical protein
VDHVDHTPAEIRRMITEIEATRADVIQISAAEIARYPDALYGHSRRARFIRVVDILNWVLGERTDASQYPCMQGWAEELAKAGHAPWTESEGVS